jgi:tRNA dimethylallyltransferase
MVDPERASALHQNDRARIFRALEIYRTTGRPQSSWRVPSTPRDCYRYLLIGLRRERKELYRIIEERVDKMFEMGLETEVYDLMKKGYDEKTPAMKGIGYKEFFSDPENPEAAIKKNSRHYAKRQMTFFSSLPDVHWMHPSEIDRIARLSKNFLLPYTA